MINIFKKLLDYIYTQNCYFCSSSKENSIFCSRCYDSVKFLPFKPIASSAEKPLYAMSYYDGTVQKLIRAVKYHNKTELVKYQAKLMFQFGKPLFENGKKYTLVPVPMFYSKARKRKYNHTDLICDELSKLTGLNVNKTSLKRIRETAPQYKLNKSEREKNLKDAFALTDNELIEPILLIDDISTTGTTLKEIIKELKKTGINDIICLVGAIPEKPSDYVY